MNHTRRSVFKLAGVALAIAAISLGAHAHGDDNDYDNLRYGKVFTSTNAPSVNELLVYAPTRRGLELVQRVSTQGQGTGAGLGSQGAVTLSGDGRYAFVVNALSNTLTTFVIRRDSIEPGSVVSTGGLTPISVAEHEGIVYVLNAGGDGNVSGFRNDNGRLKPIAGSVHPLSQAGNTNPAQVGFSADGDALVVTEKGTNRLTSYRVRDNGSISDPIVTPSSGQTPFGFSFDRRDHLFVTEAFGGAPNASALSSYRLQDFPAAKPYLVSASVPTTQTAACWVVVTPNSKYAYTTNTGSSSVSGYRIARSGKVDLLNPTAGLTPAGSRPIDAAVTPWGRELYVLSAGSQTISAFEVGADGSLKSTATVGDLPVGTVGLAAN